MKEKSPKEFLINISLTVSRLLSPPSPYIYLGKGEEGFKEREGGVDR